MQPGIPSEALGIARPVWLACLGFLARRERQAEHENQDPPTMRPMEASSALERDGTTGKCVDFTNAATSRPICRARPRQVKRKTLEVTLSPRLSCARRS